MNECDLAMVMMNIENNIQCSGDIDFSTVYSGRIRTLTPEKKKKLITPTHIHIHNICKTISSLETGIIH